MHRRDFLKYVGLVSGALALPPQLLQATGVIDLPPQEEPVVNSQGEELYRPLYGFIPDQSGDISRESLGHYPANDNVIRIPHVTRPGNFVQPLVPASTFVGANALLRNANPVIPGVDEIFSPSLATATRDLPYQPNIGWETWKEYADQPDIDPETTRLRFLGDYHLPEAQVHAAGTNQTPDSPANWQKWLDLETAREIGNINDERFDNPIPMYLKTGTDELWNFPDLELGQAITMAELCPGVSVLSEYEVTIRTVFPVIDERAGMVDTQIWCHIVHSDPAVKATCGEAHVAPWQFIRMDQMLIRVPAAVRREAERRAKQSSRIWPIDMTFQPVFGGPTREGLARVAMFTIGAIVVIGLVILVASNPQFLILAAVAA